MLLANKFLITLRYGIAFKKSSSTGKRYSCKDQNGFSYFGRLPDLERRIYCFGENVG